MANERNLVNLGSEIYLMDIVKNYELYISLIGIIISISALRLAYRVDKKLGINHIKTKQIDHVCYIIEQLNIPNIRIMFSNSQKNGGYSGIGFGLKHNIFEIANYNFIDSDRENISFEDFPVLLTKDSSQIIDIKRFIEHPLTPREIADKLADFYNTYPRQKLLSDLNSECECFVEIEAEKIEVNTNHFDKKAANYLIEGDAIVFKSWLNLKEHAKDLKKCIGEWLIANGINENNIRADFISPN